MCDYWLSNEKCSDMQNGDNKTFIVEGQENQILLKISPSSISYQLIPRPLRDKIPENRTLVLDHAFLL